MTKQEITLSNLSSNEDNVDGTFLSNTADGVIFWSREAKREGIFHVVQTGRITQRGTCVTDTSVIVK